MNRADRNDNYLSGLIEAIEDNQAIDSGMSEDELVKSKKIAEIEEMLILSGCSIKDIYKEWACKTPDQILGEYENVILPGTSTSSDFLSGWLKLNFLSIDKFGWAEFSFSEMLQSAGYPEKVGVIVADSDLLNRLALLEAGRLVEAEFKLVVRSTGINLFHNSLQLSALQETLGDHHPTEDPIKAAHRRRQRSLAHRSYDDELVR